MMTQSAQPVPRPDSAWARHPPAAVAPKATVERRAYSFGLFTAVYGLFWFLGLAHRRPLPCVAAAAIAFCLAAELGAAPFFLRVARSRLVLEPSY